MSKRNDRREAKRLARRQAYLERRTREHAQPEITAPLERKEDKEQEPRQQIDVSPAPTEEKQRSETAERKLKSQACCGGPRTLAGKAISARNALKHGGCSTSTLIIEGESLRDFEALEERWFQGYNVNPRTIKNEYETGLIRAAARADWFYQRSERNYAEAFSQLPASVLDWTDHHHRLIARFQRYRTANANILTKQRKAIEDYHKARGKELQQTQAMNHRHERLAIVRQKHDNKMDLAAPIDGRSTLSEMRQTAAARGFHQAREAPNTY